MSKKKVGSAGRFGVRYGRKQRKLVASIEAKMHESYKCAQCGLPQVGRIGTGMWQCGKCGYTFAGGAYVPVTSIGVTVHRAVSKAAEIAGASEEKDNAQVAAKKE